MKNILIDAMKRCHENFQFYIENFSEIETIADVCTMVWSELYR